MKLIEEKDKAEAGEGINLNIEEFGDICQKMDLNHNKHQLEGLFNMLDKDKNNWLNSNEIERFFEKFDPKLDFAANLLHLC